LQIYIIEIEVYPRQSYEIRSDLIREINVSKLGTCVICTLGYKNSPILLVILDFTSNQRVIGCLSFNCFSKVTKLQLAFIMSFFFDDFLYFTVSFDFFIFKFNYYRFILLLFHLFYLIVL